MTDNSCSFESRMDRFGAKRIIGTSIVTDNANGEIPALWADDNFQALLKQIISPLEGAPCYGVCRCVEGVTNGKYEYIAAVEATADAAIPEGMIECTIPEADYLIITVPGLENIKKAWEYVYNTWFPANPEWRGYCDDQGCECTSYPTFEYYTDEFFVTNCSYIYVPIRKR